MIPGLELQVPAMLLLLPLALAPLLLRRGPRLRQASLAWLPADPLGHAASWLVRGLATLALAAIVLALARPIGAEAHADRVGHGAEVMVLMDRSRSMDEHLLPADWRTVDPLSLRFQADSRGEVKAQVAGELLARFAAQRPDDRFGLMFFSVNPILAVPFSQHQDFIQAGIAAGRIGRGLSDTDVGRALGAALAEFERRPYTGSRVIMLVSDGGAELDGTTRRALRERLLRAHVSLAWFYLRSINGPELAAERGLDETRPEVALHRFFGSLSTPYHLYQAQSREDFERAVADLARRENLPVQYRRALPRREYSRSLLWIAVVACAALAGLQRFTIQSWT